MGTLITLDEYFNRIGKELFSDWSEEAVYYYSERKKELKHLRHQATKTYAVVINRIWRDGKVKVSMRLEQGYIDPPFPIENFYFAQSGCVSRDGGFYRCKLEINKGNQGRPKIFDLDDIIREYIKEYHIKKNIPIQNTSHESVVSYVKEFLVRHSMKQPHGNTIKDRLKKLYPECKKTSRNSKK